MGVVGELSLDGSLRGARRALHGRRREEEGLGALVLPEQNAPEAASIVGPGVYGVRSLAEAVGLFAGEKAIAPSPPAPAGQEEAAEEPGDDFADVAGQRYAKRALEITVSGGHNIFIFVPNTTLA